MRLSIAQKRFWLCIQLSLFFLSQTRVWLRRASCILLITYISPQGLLRCSYNVVYCVGCLFESLSIRKNRSWCWQEDDGSLLTIRFLATAGQWHGVLNFQKGFFRFLLIKIFDYVFLLLARYSLSKLISTLASSVGFDVLGYFRDKKFQDSLIP